MEEETELLTSSSFGLAPTSSLTFFPSLNRMNVGIWYAHGFQSTNETKEVGGVTTTPKKTHRSDADLARDLLLIVHIDLVELDAGRHIRQFREDGRDRLARATPVSPKVDDDISAAVDL